MFNFLNNYFKQPPTVSYCEQPIDWLIARPGAFLSNLPFIILGIWLITQKGPARQFGILALLIGLMSSLYDATYKLWAQHLDLLAMFIFVSFLFSLNIQIIFKNHKWSKLTQFIFPLICFIIIVFLGGSVGQILFFIVSIITIISYFFFPKNTQINWQPLHIGIALIAIGFLFWIPDRLQVLCFDYTLLAGRSVFHYFTAGTIYFLWKFYENKQFLELD